MEYWDTSKFSFICQNRDFNLNSDWRKKMILSKINTREFCQFGGENDAQRKFFDNKLLCFLFDFSSNNCDIRMLNYKAFKIISYFQHFVF